MSKKVKYENKCWYTYNGIGDPYQASSYRKVECKPSGLLGSKICAIYATGSFTPIAPLSTNIQQYIATALVTSSAQPPLLKKRSRYFVYLKN